MIAHISGEVTTKLLDSVIIDVNGVGYEISTTVSDLEHIPLPGPVNLHTYFSVRENAQDLYGFLSIDSKKLFVLLLGVSGVGPKVALSIVGLGDSAQVKAAIASSNVAYIQSANGVGKRGAEKVIVDLKDKVGVIGEEGAMLGGLSAQDDALQALISLGYSTQQATQSLSKIDPELSLEDKVKTALKELGV